MANELPETEAALLAATQEVPAGPVPKENQTEFCLSCGAATPQMYCGECGLKNDDLRRSLFKLIAESLGGIFSFESRMWRTWAALIFKPGKVPREYADGRRTTYSSPIRVYLVVSFLFFGFLAFSQTNLIAVAVSPKSAEQMSAEQKQAIAEESSPDAIEARKAANQEAIEAAREAFRNNDEEAAVESLKDLEPNVSLNNYNFKFLFFQPQSKFESMMDESSAKDFVKSLNENSNQTEQDAVGFGGEPIDVQKAISTFLTNPTAFNQVFNTWLPRVSFFMVPMVMFLGVIYIRGPNALLYDHLIHGIYIQSIFYMGLLLAILLSKIFPGGLIAQGLMILLLIYLPISLKRMFSRGWFKTIWTTLNIGFIYSLVLIFAILAISVVSLVRLGS